MIQVSVPGKIHLIGEHSAVYFKPAILASINLYLHTKISKSKSKEILGLIQYDNSIKKLQVKLEKMILKKFSSNLPDNPKIPNYKIEIDTSGIPIGSGLGTSASLSAAFTICLLKFLELKYRNDDVFEIALEGEKVFHGNPSGGDLAAVLNPGLIYYKKNTDATKTITPLFMDPRFLGDDVGFVLIDSGKPVESTKEMVNQVALLRAKRGNLDKVFESQENLANQMIQIFKNWDENKFIGTVKAAEENLESMGVVGKIAKSIIRKIERLGGAAKISGAGGVKTGSGMILSYHKNPDILVEFAKENKLSYYRVRI